MSESHLSPVPLDYAHPAGERQSVFCWRATGVVALVLLALNGMAYVARVAIDLQTQLGASTPPWVETVRSRVEFRASPSMDWLILALLPPAAGVLWAFSGRSTWARVWRRYFAIMGVVTFFLAGGVIVYACVAPMVEMRSRFQYVRSQQEDTPLPMRFSSAHALYTFLAHTSDEPADPDGVVTFAAGCMIDTRSMHDEQIMVIAPTYGQGGASIRGQPGNGYYYFVKPVYLADRYTCVGYDLVGIAGGNHYDLYRRDGTLWLETHWRSGVDSDTRRYRFDTGAFRPTELPIPASKRDPFAR